jgi:cardiolipin synthase A/B
MPAIGKDNDCEWISSGEEIFSEMLRAIDTAQISVRLEIYIFAGDEVGTQFRDALVRAQQRGVRVSALIDAFGSQSLATNYWEPLKAAGGEARWFNPMLLRRFGFRDHRKMLVCDEAVAFIGGFNISAKYAGDGVTRGWRDLGMRISGPLAQPLAAAFDEMFERADVEHKAFTLLRRTSIKRSFPVKEVDLLLTGPGRGPNPFTKVLDRDLAGAQKVQIICAYFLPTWRIRRKLARVARRGGRVQLVLPGKSDVYLSQLAGRSLYRRLLRAGVEIYEYQPQILHAKLVVVDNVVYAGSSNLDPRSLKINYELMLRFQDRELAEGAREYFAETLAHSERIELAAWRKSRTWWRRFKQRWAYFILARVDPYVASWQYKQTGEVADYRPGKSIP